MHHPALPGLVDPGSWRQPEVFGRRVVEAERQRFAIVELFPALLERGDGGGGKDKNPANELAADADVQGPEGTERGATPTLEIAAGGEGGGCGRAEYLRNHHERFFLFVCNGWGALRVVWGGLVSARSPPRFATSFSSIATEMQRV